MLYSVFRQMVRLPEFTQTRISSLAPRKSRRAYFAGLTLTLALAVAGCATTTAPDQAADDSAVTPTPEVTESPKESAQPSVGQNLPPKEAPVTAQPNVAAPSEKQPDTDEMITVSVYTIDDQCNDFIEQSVQVPSGQAMDEAVAKAVNSVEYNAFKLDSYQVNINGSTAIVDMSVAPGSERQLVSLSSCEQRALFGSVEETLLNNPDWDVEAVKFTDGGKELVL